MLLCIFQIFFFHTTPDQLGAAYYEKVTVSVPKTRHYVHINQYKLQYTDTVPQLPFLPNP